MHEADFGYLISQFDVGRFSAADLEALAEIRNEQSRRNKVKYILPVGVALAGLAAMACSGNTITDNQVRVTPIPTASVESRGGASFTKDNWTLFAFGAVVALGLAGFATVKAARR